MGVSSGTKKLSAAVRVSCCIAMLQDALPGVVSEAHRAMIRKLGSDEVLTAFSSSRPRTVARRSLTFQLWLCPKGQRILLVGGAVSIMHLGQPPKA